MIKRSLLLNSWALRWRQQFLWGWMAPWLIPVGLVLLWELLAELGLIPTRVLPAPSQILEAAWRLSLNGTLFYHLGTSLQRAGLGLVIGGTIGLTLGILNGVSGVAERLLDGSLQMLRTIPHLALIPLVILWFGIEEESRIFLVALGVFFPVYLNTFHGTRSVDPDLIEMGKVYGLRFSALFWQVILPSALPNILVGLRYALGRMWLTLIVAETIATDAGIGYLATEAREFMQTDVVGLSIVLYALLGKCADLLVRFLEQWWLPWHPSQHTE
jgi:sulfonate transport system permease protein